MASLTAALEPRVAQIFRSLRVCCCWARRDSVLFLVPEPLSRTIKGSWHSSFIDIWASTGVVGGCGEDQLVFGKRLVRKFGCGIFAPTTPSSSSLLATASTIFAESLMRISNEISGYSFLKDAASPGRIYAPGIVLAPMISSPETLSRLAAISFFKRLQIFQDSHSSRIEDFGFCSR